MIRSLDELVTDIEDTSAHTTDQQAYMAAPVMAGLCSRAVSKESEQQQSQLSMADVVADVSRQLSEKLVCTTALQVLMTCSIFYGCRITYQ